MPLKLIYKNKAYSPYDSYHKIQNLFFGGKGMWTLVWFMTMYQVVEGAWNLGPISTY